jgi:hypothetical protein
MQVPTTFPSLLRSIAAPTYGRPASANAVYFVVTRSSHSRAAARSSTADFAPPMKRVTSGRR